MKDENLNINYSPTSEIIDFAYNHERLFNLEDIILKARNYILKKILENYSSDNRKMR